MSTLSRSLTVAAVALATAMAGAPAATAAEDTSQARAWPGPQILNEPEAKAPQLENTGIWKADPTRVCMSSAYREGEFLHQGCLWDDHGAGPDEAEDLHLPFL